MLIFIDTEFTDFNNPELISIGLVTEDGKHQFYAELPVNREKCSDFVLTTVLPNLDKTPSTQCTVDELNDRLRNWLGQFKDRVPVTICYDYSTDGQLLRHALNYEMPDWLAMKNIYLYIDEFALQSYFIDNKLTDHHALHDANENRHAFDNKKAKVDGLS